MNAKEVLDELKWRGDRDLARAVIWYVHRGAPGDSKRISGSEILELDRSFMHTAGSTIPYHRIFRIEYEGQVLLER